MSKKEKTEVKTEIKSGKEEFKKQMKKLASEYDSQVSNEKVGSSTKQQSINTTNKLGRSKSIHDLTENEFFDMYGGY